MMPPHMRSVAEEGETALLYRNGVFSHAIRKGPVLTGLTSASMAVSNHMER
jgi:hypothetical protein